MATAPAGAMGGRRRPRRRLVIVAAVALLVLLALLGSSGAGTGTDDPDAAAASQDTAAEDRPGNGSDTPGDPDGDADADPDGDADADPDGGEGAGDATDADGRAGVDGRDDPGDQTAGDTTSGTAGGNAADADRGAGPADDAAAAGAGATASTVTGELEVHYLDVGQADATLLLHDEVAMLVDTGDWRRTDVVAALEGLGVEQLDLVVVTHPHADHIGQFELVMRRFDVAEVWWSGAVTTSQTFGRALDALEASDAAYEEPRAGDRTTVGPLVIDVVGPDPDADVRDVHDANLSLRVTYGAVSFLFTGDVEARTETRMVARHGPALAADVYQAGHHGSDTSTTSTLLEAVDPTVTIISSGADNPYGHPHARVLDRLAAHRTAVYGTAANGTIVVRTDGTDLTVTGQRSGATTPGGVGLSGSAAGATPGCVDLNSASAEALQDIIHIGPARAPDIISGRPWTSVSSRTRLSGIGPARIADIAAQGVACVR